MDKKINSLYKFSCQKDEFIKRETVFNKRVWFRKKDFLSVIDGMKMDTKTKITFPSTKKLMAYCEKVAVAVGYLSIKIFEVEKNSGKQYAYSLGMALQLTNIAGISRRFRNGKMLFAP